MKPRHALLASVLALVTCGCGGVNICKINPQLCVPQPPPSSPTPEPTNPPHFPPVTQPPAPQGCTAPPGSTVRILNDASAPVNLPLAQQFISRFVDPTPPRADSLVERVLVEIEQMTGCPRKKQPCMTEEPQAFFSHLSERLRAKGVCAGQFEPGVQDGITVSLPDSELPAWAHGLWNDMHVVAYSYKSLGGPSVAWGKIMDATPDKRAVWQEVGEGEQPGPLPTPTPGPGPTPPPPANPNGVASAKITSSALTAKGPATVNFQCFPKNSAGQAIGNAPSVFFIGAQFGGPINKNWISETHAGLKGVLTIKAGCPTGTIKAYCSWYPDITATGKEVVTSVVVQVNQ